jgi:hypothetical protein
MFTAISLPFSQRSVLNTSGNQFRSVSDRVSTQSDQGLHLSQSQLAPFYHIAIKYVKLKIEFGHKIVSILGLG